MQHDPVPAGVTRQLGLGRHVSVMRGLLAPTEGEVLFDGAPIHRLGLSHYRALIGTVMQEDRLFSGSVADHICFFDAQPDLERIEDCARLASVDAEIRR